MSVVCPKVFDELVALSFGLVSSRLPVTSIPHILKDVFPCKDNCFQRSRYPNLDVYFLNKSYETSNHFSCTTYCGRGFGSVTLFASALIFIPDFRMGHKQIRSRWAMSNLNISCCCCSSSSLVLPFLFRSLTRWSRDWQP